VPSCIRWHRYGGGTCQLEERLATFFQPPEEKVSTAFSHDFGRCERLLSHLSPLLNHDCLVSTRLFAYAGFRLEELVHPSWLEVLTDPVRLGLLRSLLSAGPTTAGELARRSHASDPTVRRHLDALLALGFVHEHRGESDGLTRGRPATRYDLDPEVRERTATLFMLLADPPGSLRGSSRRLPRGR